MQPQQQLQAYTRDPKALFSASSSSLSAAAASSRRRAVRRHYYRNAVFAVDVGLPAGTRMHTVAVDWHKGAVTAFADSNDAINNVPCFTGTVLPACEPSTADQYVRETFEFLRRGHSLFHPNCRCFPRRRAHELGFALWGDTGSDSSSSEEEEDQQQPGYIGYCTVGTTGQGRSVREVELELGVRSLYGLVAAGGEMLPLMQVLVRLAGLHLHTEGLLLSTPICCVPPEIVTGQHILAAARALYPRALVCGETCFGDLQRLKASGALRVLCIAANEAGQKSSSYAVFWRPPYYDRQWRRADRGVRQLWEQQAAASPPQAPPLSVAAAAPHHNNNHHHQQPRAASQRCYYHLAGRDNDGGEDASEKKQVDEEEDTTKKCKKRKRAPLRLYGSRRR